MNRPYNSHGIQLFMTGKYRLYPKSKYLIADDGLAWAQFKEIELTPCFRDAITEKLTYY